MGNDTPPANGRNSSTPDDQAPLNVVCFDSEHADQACPICGGKGVVRYSVPPDHPRFGKLFRCPNFPAEVDIQRQKRLRDMSNLGAFADKDFHNFELPNYYAPKEREALRIAHERAMHYAETLDGWLLLEGSYGTGKTHLAAAVGNQRLKRAEQVLFITTPDLLDHLRATFGKNSDAGYDETFERMRNAPLLILDDLGTENPSEWAQEKLFQLLNHRYSHRIPTVITTNVELDDLDPRIRSRLLDTEVIHRLVLNVPDYRSATQNSNKQLQSQLPMYAHMTFDSFDIVMGVTAQEHDNLLKAARIAEEFAHRPTNWLVFMGSYGVGKTHLAAAIANQRNKQGDDVMFQTSVDLLDYLRTTFNADTNITFDRLFDQMRNVPLLVVDDLGTESAKPWAQEKLFQLLDYRYVSQKPTVITTAKQFEAINERIRSRLIDTRICRNVAITATPYAMRLKR